MTTILHKNLDANESIFFERELTQIKNRVQEKQYPELKVADGVIIPIATDTNPGAETIKYEMYDTNGMAILIANYASDLPRSDVSGQEFFSPIKSMATSFGYNIQEIRAAAMAGKPLTTRKAMAARRSIDQLIQSIALYGNAQTGLKGFINHPNIQEYTLPNDGTGASTKLSTKTPDKILRDLNGMENQVTLTTNGVESVDTLILSLSLYSYLSSTPRSDNSDTTILEYFLRNSPGITNIETLVEFTNASDNGTEDIMMMYKRDPDVLELEIPVAYEQLAPQAKGLEFVVPVHGRIGGVVIRKPMAIIKAQGAN